MAKGRGGGKGGPPGPEFLQRVRRGAQKRALSVWMNNCLVLAGFEPVQDVREGLKDGVVLQQVLIALKVEV